MRKTSGLDPSAPDLVEKITFLPLEVNEKNLIGNIDKVVIENGRIYVGDYRQGRIAVFSRTDGSLLEVVDIAMEQGNFQRGSGAAVLIT